jgi:hypothetical protein
LVAFAERIIPRKPARSIMRGYASDGSVTLFAGMDSLKDAAWRSTNGTS